jgi:hypothetical protein
MDRVAMLRRRGVTRFARPLGTQQKNLGQTPVSEIFLLPFQA